MIRDLGLKHLEIRRALFAFGADAGDLGLLALDGFLAHFEAFLAFLVGDAFLVGVGCLLEWDVDLVVGFRGGFRVRRIVLFAVLGQDFLVHLFVDIGIVVRQDCGKDCKRKRRGDRRRSKSIFRIHRFTSCCFRLKVEVMGDAPAVSMRGCAVADVLL